MLTKSEQETGLIAFYEFVMLSLLKLHTMKLQRTLFDDVINIAPTTPVLNKSIVKQLRKHCYHNNFI